MDSFKLSLSNLAALGLVFIFNFLTATGKINNLSQAEISEMFPTKITPAGFAFSIWGVIYSLVLVTIIFMIVTHKQDKMSQTIQAIGWWFNISALANILWTISFSYLKLPLSTLLIFILLISLVMILVNLSRLRFRPKPIFTLTFGLYSGWVMIATVVNIAASLVQLNWNGFGLPQVIWANIVLILAIFIVFVVAYRTTNGIIPLPVAWAYFAIFKAEDNRVAFIGIFVLLIISIYQLYKNKYFIQNSTN